MFKNGYFNEFEEDELPVRIFLKHYSPNFIVVSFKLLFL
jgi:hypothetical protein